MEPVARMMKRFFAIIEFITIILRKSRSTKATFLKEYEFDIDQELISTPTLTPPQSTPVPH
jgi:hypothetical protein